MNRKRVWRDWGVGRVGEGRLVSGRLRIAPCALRQRNASTSARRVLRTATALWSHSGAEEIDPQRSSLALVLLITKDKAEVITRDAQGHIGQSTKIIDFPSQHYHGLREPLMKVQAVQLWDVPSTAAEPHQPRFLVASPGAELAKVDTIRHGINPDWRRGLFARGWDSNRPQDFRLRRGPSSEDVDARAVEKAVRFGSVLTGPTTQAQADATAVKGIFIVGGGTPLGPDLAAVSSPEDRFAPSLDVWVLGSGGGLETAPPALSSFVAAKKAGLTAAKTASRQLRRLPPLREPRMLAAAAVVDGSLWVVGGMGAGGRLLGSVERLPLVGSGSGRTLAWRPGPPLPIPVHSATAARVKFLMNGVAEERLVLVGGTTHRGAPGRGSALSLLLKPDAAAPHGFVWDVLGSLCQPRINAALTEFPPWEECVGTGVEPMLLCLGGSEDPTVASTMELMDFSAAAHQRSLATSGSDYDWVQIPLRTITPAHNIAAISLL